MAHVGSPYASAGTGGTGKRRLAALTLVTMIALVSGCAQDRAVSSHTSAAPARFGTPLNAPVPAPLLSIPLRDSTGRMTSLGAMRGKVLVVSDIMTLCQETCAIGTASMLQAARAIDRTAAGRKVDFLSITIDPARDDVAHLAAYRRLFGGFPNWRVLTGSPADINRLWTRLGVWRHTVKVAKPYPRDWLTGAPLRTDINHTDDLIFVNPRQRFRFLIDGTGSVRSPGAIPPRIWRFMDRLGHRNVRNPGQGSWSAAQVGQVLHWMLSSTGGSS